MRLTYDFYNRHVVDVAKDLLGKTLVFGNHQGVIIETEVYRGYDDEASHAFRGCTNRSSIMFGPRTYLYLFDLWDVLLFKFCNRRTRTSQCCFNKGA